MTQNTSTGLSARPSERLRFLPGDTLSIGSGSGLRKLYKVIARRRTGYQLEEESTGDRREWPDREIFDTYINGDLEHFRTDLTALAEAAREMLEMDFALRKPAYQRTARYREVFCRKVDELRNQGHSRDDACKHVIDNAYVEAQATPEIWVIEQPKPGGGRSKPIPLVAPPPVPRFAKPSWYTVRNWYRRWVPGGRDVRALLPYTERSGDRSPRYPDLRRSNSDPDNPKCVYGAMELIARTVFMNRPRVSSQYAYDRLVALCQTIGVTAIHYSNFNKFLKRHFNDFEEYRLEHGSLAAYYRFGIFGRRTRDVRFLEEFEIDHTLIDMVVIDEQGRKLRPWLTLVLDVATRMIVGFHIGFDVPSYATVQRAIIHSIAVKDLSSIKGLQNPWPCHGVPLFVVTDRGLEFLSASLRNACSDLGIQLMNLPPRTPHLKGAVERFFGTLNTRVFNVHDGAIRSYVTDEYDPYQRAKMSLKDLTEKIVRWIVDEYHVTHHETIGTTPLEKWQELAASEGVTPINQLQRLITLCGETVTRKISNTGIEFENHTYQSDALEELRMRRGGRQKDWEIRIDPYDRGHIWILDNDPVARRWLTVPAVYQKTAKGFSKYAGKVHRMMARSLAAAGGEITQDIMEQAVEICRRDLKGMKNKQAARYLADGALATPVVGSCGLIGSILDPGPAARYSQPAKPPANDTGLAPAAPSSLEAELARIAAHRAGGGAA